MVAHTAASNTVLQTIVEEDKRGRLMSFYTLTFVGTAPLGSLLSGLLADRIGTSATILLCGLASISGSLVFALALPGLRRSLRSIYLRAGILTEDAAGPAARYHRPPAASARGTSPAMRHAA